MQPILSSVNITNYEYAIELQHNYVAEYISILTNNYSDNVIIENLLQEDEDKNTSTFNPLLLTLDNVVVTLPKILSPNSYYEFKLTGEKFHSTKLSIMGQNMWGIEDVELFKHIDTLKNPKVSVEHNGSFIGQRDTLNFIGSSPNLIVSDNSLQERVDITIAPAGGTVTASGIFYDAILDGSLSTTFVTLAGFNGSVAPTVTWGFNPETDPTVHYSTPLGSVFITEMGTGYIKISSTVYESVNRRVVILARGVVSAPTYTTAERSGFGTASLAGTSITFSPTAMPSATYVLLLTTGVSYINPYTDQDTRTTTGFTAYAAQDATSFGYIAKEQT
jgi:hypothetical protein